MLWEHGQPYRRGDASSDTAVNYVHGKLWVVSASAQHAHYAPLVSLLSPATTTQGRPRQWCPRQRWSRCAARARATCSCGATAVRTPGATATPVPCTGLQAVSMGASRPPVATQRALEVHCAACYQGCFGCQALSGVREQGTNGARAWYSTVGQSCSSECACHSLGIGTVSHVQSNGS